MIDGFQKFVRGCFIDPELERKAHMLTDDTRKVVLTAQETLKRANGALGKANELQQLALLAGLGLIVAGFVAGSMSAKATEKS